MTRFAFETISEKEVLAYAMKGLCEVIIRAPMQDLDGLNAKFDEMYQRRNTILAAEAEAPFDCD